jgi:trehalose synthase
MAIPGDGGPLEHRERETYDASLDTEHSQLRALVAPRDMVVLHDPQTAGLARP